MACDPVTEYVVSESNRLLPGEIYSRTFPESPWMSLTERGEYPEGIGYDPITVMTAERSAPTDANPTWTDVNITGLEDNVEGGACLPPAEIMKFGITKRTFNLQEKVIKTPKFCAVSLFPAFQLGMQLDRIWDNMALYTRILWELRDRYEYLRICSWKVVADEGANCGTTLTEGVEDFDSYDCSQHTIGMLTQGLLDRWSLRLLRDGAGRNAEGIVAGIPQLTLITDPETSEGIFMTNGDRRNDLRFGEPSKLLAAFGTGGAYKGFFHLLDLTTIRGECSNKKFTPVPPYVISTTSQGFKVDMNPTWENATLGVSFIHNRRVLKQLIPRPIVAPHPQFQFNPVNYTATWKAMNILDEDCNPEGTIIHFRGHMMSGSMPEHPQYGVAFLHRICKSPCQRVIECPAS